MAVMTWPNIYHLPISKPELVNVLTRMGQQIKTFDSNRNPNRWCDFHSDHGHKTEDCVAQTSAARSTQVHDDKDSDSEMENEEEAPEGVTTSKTTITAYLEDVLQEI
uniref:Uncharacterized protein n=1 Tax=Brassica oleracea TaxID=3712 RepID=A0A3P6DDS7_BRAOL|nr:unnamed protein product [Brassica oleracea]